MFYCQWISLPQKNSDEVFILLKFTSNLHTDFIYSAGNVPNGHQQLHPDPQKLSLLAHFRPLSNVDSSSAKQSFWFNLPFANRDWSPHLWYLPDHPVWLSLCPCSSHFSGTSFKISKGAAKKTVFFLRILCLPFLHSLLLLRFKLRPAVFKVVIYLSVIKKWRDLIQAYAFLPSSMTDMVPSPNLYAYLPFLLAGAFLNKIFYLCFWLGDSETRYWQAYSPIYPWCKKAQ